MALSVIRFKVEHLLEFTAILIERGRPKGKEKRGRLLFLTAGVRPPGPDEMADEMGTVVLTQLN